MYQNNQIRLVYPGCDRCDWSIGIGLRAEMYRYNCQRPLDSFQMRCRSDALVYRVERFPPQTGDRAVDGKSVFFVVLSRASLRLWSDHGLPTVLLSPLDPSLNPKHYWGL